jgi:hypothetical protein
MILVRRSSLPRTKASATTIQVSPGPNMPERIENPTIDKMRDRFFITKKFCVCNISLSSWIFPKSHKQNLFTAGVLDLETR